MSDDIIWKKDRLLQVDDFQGVPDSAQNKLQATTGTTFLPQTDYDIIKSKSKTKLKINFIFVQAIFRPSVSWFKKDQLHPDNWEKLLKHEQGHFDLVEIYARKFEPKLNQKFKNKSFTCKGKTDGEKEEFCIKEIKKLTEDYFNKLRPEYIKFDEKYDSDTKHGIDKEKQKEYDQLFDKLRE